MKNVKAGHIRPIVCLDAGHYGKYNRSPVIPAYYESEMNWKLHLLLKAELEKYGIEVHCTRRNIDGDMGLVERGKTSAGSDLFLSLHSNAVGSGANESVDYPVVYVQLDGTGNLLGNRIATMVAEVMGTKQKGRIATRKGNNGEYYGVLRGAAAVGTMGMIIEHSFHTNTAATKWLMQDSNLQLLAKREAKLVAEYYGIGESENKTEEEVVCAVNVKELSRGAKGDQVKAMQILLLGYGYKMTNNGRTYGADGDFGGATENAVKAYQADNGLDADGICGPKTWASLLGS